MHTSVALKGKDLHTLLILLRCYTMMIKENLLSFRQMTTVTRSKISTHSTVGKAK